MVRLIVSIVLGFIIWQGYNILKLNGWHYSHGSRTSKIFSLKTTNEVNGHFILGIGGIDGNDYYVFYRQTESGGLIREKLYTSDCVLYEVGGEPKVTEYGEKGYYLEDGDTTKTSFSRGFNANYFHCIYIPKGTITERVDDIKLN